MTFKGTKGKWTRSELVNFSGTVMSFIRCDGKQVAQLRGNVTGEEEVADTHANLFALAGNLAQKHDPETWGRILDERKQLSDEATELKSALKYWADNEFVRGIDGHKVKGMRPYRLAMALCDKLDNLTKKKP